LGIDPEEQSQKKGGMEEEGMADAVEEEATREVRDVIMTQAKIPTMTATETIV
jgi:hypothetical protein